MSCVVSCDDKLSESEIDSIERWLVCDHCTNGERDSVRVLGDRAVPALANRLRGPAPAPRENMRRRVLASYVPGSAMSQNEYVGLMLENFEAVYQKRAASALAAIGTQRAIDALRVARDSALVRRYRTDVKRAVERAFENAAFDTLNGSLSDSSVVFGDTVIVKRGSLAWDGDESVSLPGSPFADSLVVKRRPDSLWFIAAADRGDYNLSVTRVGPQQDTQVVPLSIVRLRRPRTAGDALQVTAVTAAPFPQIHFTVLGVIPTDTTDHYRFETSADMAVTAAVETVGLVTPFVRWYDCNMTLTHFSPAPLRGTVVNEQGVGVAGAQVRIPPHGTSFPTNPSGRFSTSPLFPLAGISNVDISATGFRPNVQRIQAFADSVRISLIGATTSQDSARSQYAMSIRIPAGTCQMLQVGVRSGVGRKIIRLRLTSP